MKKRSVFKNLTMALTMTTMLMTPLTAFASEGEEPVNVAYERAIIDAMQADKDEVKPLVNINPEDPNTFWNEDKTHILVATFHRWPDSYPDNTVLNTSWGDGWVTSVQEFIGWYKNNSNGVDDWNLRYKQLMGLPETSKNNTVSLMWVTPDSLNRPAFVRDINSQMTNTFEIEPDADYLNWFNEYSCSSYQTHGYPWTRLGYTYDWADNGTSKGLCEFLLKKGSDVVVEKTMTLDEYVSWVAQ